MAQYTTPVTIPYELTSTDAHGKQHKQRTSTILTGARWGNSMPDKYMEVEEGHVRFSQPPHPECTDEASCMKRCEKMVKRGEQVAWSSVGLLLAIGGIAGFGIMLSLWYQRRSGDAADEKSGKDVVQQRQQRAAEEGRRVVSTGMAPEVPESAVTRRSRSDA